MGNYYLTYPVTVQDEVATALKRPKDFVEGPLPVLRNSPTRMSRGFPHRDGQCLSARWPGDAYNFATDFLHMLQENASNQD